MVVKFIQIKDIILPKTKLREKLNEEKTKELMGSIKAVGLLHPITVRKEKDKFILIIGFRRLTAHERLGLKEIRAEIDESHLGSDELRELPLEQQDLVKRLIENYHRVQGEYLKEMDVVNDLYDFFYEKSGSPKIKHIDSFHHGSVSLVANLIGVSRMWILRRLRVQKTSDETITLMKKFETEGKRLPLEVASRIGGKIKDEEKQKQIVKALLGQPQEIGMEVVDKIAESKKDLDPITVVKEVQERKKKEEDFAKSLRKPELDFAYVSFKLPNDLYLKFTSKIDEMKTTEGEILEKLITKWVEERFEL